MSDISTRDTATFVQNEASYADFFALLKPRVMSLVVFTGFAGMWLAPGFSDMHPLLIFIALLCLAVGAGAAGAINMWYDRDIDLIMTRTKNRPVPSGKISPEDALTFAIALSIMAIVTMGLMVNWFAAGLLAFANFFYSVIYTIWLKRTTPQNIVIGGAAGAFPPVIGWAAISGDITFDSLILFMIIFLWTPPHFWALSLFAGKDYAKANIPMMNVVKGERYTKIQMLAYTLILLPVSLLPYASGLLNEVYFLSAFVLGTFFIFTACKVLKDTSQKSARLMFGYSVFYLFALFLSALLSHSFDFAF